MYKFRQQSFENSERVVNSGGRRHRGRRLGYREERAERLTPEAPEAGRDQEAAPRGRGPSAEAGAGRRGRARCCPGAEPSGAQGLGTPGQACRPATGARPRRPGDGASHTTLHAFGTCAQAGFAGMAPAYRPYTLSGSREEARGPARAQGPTERGSAAWRAVNSGPGALFLTLGPADRPVREDGESRQGAGGGSSIPPAPPRPCDAPQALTA